MEPQASTSKTEAESPQPTEIEEFYDKLKLKNVELKEEKKYLQLENEMHKRKYNDLKQRLAILTQSLQKNAHVYQQLFDDTNSALKICTSGVLSSPIQKKKKFNCTVDARPGPSRVLRPVVPHRKIHIEPLKIQELEDNAKEDEEELVAEQTTRQEEEEVQQAQSNSVSTIIDEEKAIELTMKDVFVRLHKLPSDIVRQHVEDFSIKETPTKNPVSSTPKERISFMNTLGLSPNDPRYQSPPVHNFVSGRKKYSRGSSHSSNSLKSNVSAKSSILISNCSNNSTNSTIRGATNTAIILENNPSSGCSSTVKSESDEKENFVTKRRKVSLGSPIIGSTRPSRKARPGTLKEESLRKKKRRH